MLTDVEIRHLAITLLTQQTDRDKQRRVGASDLSDACDYCLAVKLQGGIRDSALSRKTWLGRVQGTATHNLFEDRIDGLTADERRIIAGLMGATAESHVWFGELGSYGVVGGSIDLLLEDQVVDWKGSTRKKSALMQDYLQSIGSYRIGLPSRWKQMARGNWKLEFSDCSYSLSDAEYKNEIAHQVTKVTRYFGQAMLYCKGSGRKRASLVFWNRDGTGFWDVPTEAGYEDPLKFHDVWVLSFDYNADYADALLNRANFIWSQLEAGASAQDFPRHKHCFICSNEEEPSVPAVEATFGGAA